MMIGGNILYKARELLYSKTCMLVEFLTELTGKTSETSCRRHLFRDPDLEELLCKMPLLLKKLMCSCTYRSGHPARLGLFLLVGVLTVAHVSLLSLRTQGFRSSRARRRTSQKFPVRVPVTLGVLIVTYNALRAMIGPSEFWNLPLREFIA